MKEFTDMSTINSLIKVQADNVNGIYVVDEFDTDADVIPNDIFFMCIDDADDNEAPLACEITQAQLARVIAEYGLNTSISGAIR